MSLLNNSLQYIVFYKIVIKTISRGIKMFLERLFVRKCTHPNISPDIENAYCPDCGKLIRNEWFVTRCACCGVKLKTMVKQGKIAPQRHYCSNCGSNEFTIEKLDKISFININFAVLIKHVIENDTIHASTVSLWQEKSIEQPRLLTQSL